jgi:hypothetical protein
VGWTFLETKLEGRVSMHVEDESNEGKEVITPDGRFCDVKCTIFRADLCVIIIAINGPVVGAN